MKGEFVWHHHDDEDELFLVISGLLKMEFRDRTVLVGEVHMLLFEPASTLNTGNVQNEKTRTNLEKI